ncbi:hypothetical protein Leryth_006484 [Lithospermum erythrorhizon]|nr:hypothetical protein Leryth_006484 [Lithospermum erythrorhizon]
MEYSSHDNGNEKITVGACGEEIVFTPGKCDIVKCQSICEARNPQKHVVGRCFTIDGCTCTCP